MYSSILKVNQSTQDQKNKKQFSSNKKHVSFSAHPDDICLNNDEPLTNEEIKSTWYSNDDTIRMKYNAKILAQKFRRSTVVTEISDNSQSSEQPLMLPRRFNNDNNESLSEEGSVDNECRGLENIIFLKRQVKQVIATHAILKCQRKIKSRIAIAKKHADPKLKVMVATADRTLGIISAKYTRWSKILAFVTGKFDYEAVYNVPRNSLYLDERFLNKKRKSMNESFNSSHQRKKKLTKIPHYREIKI